MADETYYSLLEVSEVATATEIKAAYIRLIREVHPDRLVNAPAYWQRQAEEKAKEVNEAYTVLSNREKRRLYDAQLALYRGSREANSRPSSANPSSSNTAQQQSPPASGPRYSSGAYGKSAQSSGHAWQQHGSSSASPPHSAKNPTASGMNAGQRLSFALAASPFAFGAAYDFWGSTSIGEEVFLFVLAWALFFGIACLYQRRIRQLYAAVGISRSKQHLWVTIGAIAMFLFTGKIAFIRSESQPLSLKSQPSAGPSRNDISSIPKGYTLTNKRLSPDELQKLETRIASQPKRSEFMLEDHPTGLVSPGNIDIWNGPVVQNADGSHNIEYSTTFRGDKGREVVVPTVVNGKFLTPDGKKPKEGSLEEKAMFRRAWQHYERTGENLGVFDNPKNAEAYARKLQAREIATDLMNNLMTDSTLDDLSKIAGHKVHAIQTKPIVSARFRMWDEEIKKGTDPDTAWKLVMAGTAMPPESDCLRNECGHF